MPTRPSDPTGVQAILTRSCEAGMFIASRYFATVRRATGTPEAFGGKDGCNEYLVLTKPSAVAKVHEDFFDVGCDAVEDGCG